MRGPGANVKTRYAVQAVIYLAGQERERVAPVSAIAAALGIAPKFLEDILGALRSAGIVQSRRGKEGGYQLIPAPAELSVLAVVEAMEGPAAPVAREAGYPPKSGGPMAEVTARAFDRALQAATQLLDELTIEQLAEEAGGSESPREPAYMYYL